MRTRQAALFYLVVGLVWSGMTVGLYLFYTQFDAKLPLWLPSGVLVAAIYYSGLRQWFLCAPLVLVMRTLAFLLVDFSWLDAFTLTAGALASATVYAACAIWLLGSAEKYATNLRQIIGLFLAALVGNAVGWLPFVMRAEMLDLERFTRSYLSDMLGILVLSPVLFELLRRYLGGDKTGTNPLQPQLALSLLQFAALSVVTLLYGGQLLFPFLVCAMAYVGARHGQFGATLAVMVLGLCGMIMSVDGNLPIPAAGGTRNENALLFQMWMLGMLAIALPIAAMVRKRDELQVTLVNRNDRLHESVTIFGLAEQVAGIGRWRQDLRTGEQEWSPLMLELYGLPRELGPDPGDMRQLLPDGGAELYSQLDANAEAVEPFSLTYRVKPPGSTERILQMSILNEFAADGKRIGVFGVAMDVTQQVHREEALDLARGRAVKLAAEAQKLANTDPLTSLPNRRCTFERLESLIADSTRREFALAAVMFDIDHFKRINDTFGHQTGDEVIVQVSELARRQTRKGDLVGRIGGEEFVWLLPHMNPEAARRSAERLRDAVEKGTESANVPPVTISVGLAMFRAGDTAETLLARADAALYEAKEGGRNMVKRAA